MHAGEDKPQAGGPDQGNTPDIRVGSRADRAYVPWEELQPGCMHALWVRGDMLSHVPSGPEEHRIDAYQLRNEAAFINDWRDDVQQKSEDAPWARRHANAAVVTILVGSQAHALVWATEHIPEGREILFDYGDPYWEAYRKATAKDELRLDLDCADLSELEAHEPLDRDSLFALSVAGQGGSWTWVELDRASTVALPKSTLPLLSSCSSSLAAVNPADPAAHSFEFPGCVRKP
jgi:hypothetical protein